MNAIMSNGWLAWVAALLTLAVGVGTYAFLGTAQGFAPARFDPYWAAAVSLMVVTATFYVIFGVFSMQWLGWRYWIYAPLYNAAWFAAFVVVGEGWMRGLGYLYGAVSVAMVLRLAPKGGLAAGSGRGGQS